MNPVKIEFSDEAKQTLIFFTESAANFKKERMLLNAVMKKIDLIKHDPHYGNSVPKELIPDYYKQKYEVKNLFRVELPLFWRMTYTLKKETNKIEIISFIIEIIDHKKYNKRFSYNKH